MSKRILILLFILFAVTIVSGTLLARAEGQPTSEVRTAEAAFTYHGELQFARAAASGLYDFQFSLYDSPAGSQQIGRTVAIDQVELLDGEFSVPLNFGPLQTAGRYLEVALRPSHSDDAFTTLTPRQTLESAQSAFPSVVTHTHSVNPGAFLYDEDSTEVVMSIYYGLRWVANTNERAGFYMARPADWDGQSPVKVRITFALGNNNAGAVNWRLRLNTYTPNGGEWLTNPAARDADQILAFASGPSSLRIYDQTFTLQPGDFNDEPYWSLFFTRGDATNGETFTGNLYVMGVDVVYQAIN